MNSRHLNGSGDYVGGDIDLRSTSCKDRGFAGCLTNQKNLRFFPNISKPGQFVPEELDVTVVPKSCCDHERRCV